MCLKFEMKLLVDIPMVFGLVMLDMDAHMFMLTSLDFLWFSGFEHDGCGCEHVWLKGEPTNKTCCFVFSNQIQGGCVTCPLNQSNEVFVSFWKFPNLLVDFPINLQIKTQQVTMTGAGYDDGWHSDGWMSCDSFRRVSKINVARGIG